MTRAEAIKHLTDIKEWYTSDRDFSYYDDEYHGLSEEENNALNMAIEALENSQNCVKCVHYYETEDERGVHSHCEQEPYEDKRTDKRTETHACDCISRQDAIAEVLKHRNHAPKRYWSEYTRGWNDAIDSVADHYLLDVPSSEPKRGEWERFNYSDGDVMECTNCGYRDWRDRWLEDEAHNYCPNCGAKMETEQ